MKNFYKSFGVITSLLLFATVSAWAEAPRGSMDPARVNDPGSTVAQAANVYKALGKEKKVPTSITTNAKCVAVFPQVVTAALGVGGIHGDGVAFCRNASTNGWSNPVFLNLTGGSIGLQAGVKTTDVVLFITGDKARKAIQDGEFRVTGDFSAVAGTYDEAYMPPTSGVVSYASNEGVFAGASLVGIGMSHDQDEQKAFYGNYDRSSIFEGKIPADVEKSVNELRNLLPA